MKKIALVTNAGPATGVGHYARALQKSLATGTRTSPLDLTLYMVDGVQNKLMRERETVTQLSPLPGILKHKTINWIRLGHKLKSLLRTSKYDIVHPTNQTMSFLATRNTPSVVTVHDLIEIISPQSRAGAISAKYLYRGISKAAHIICVSNYTANTVQQIYGIAAEHITVIPNGVDPVFHVIQDFKTSVAYHTLLQELKIKPNSKIVLYVGSEHPRKNLATALIAFAQATAQMPNLLFVKVGESGLPAGRADLLNQIDQLNIRDKVLIMGHVSQDALNELYNFADVFIYPSRFEGFGLPPLQAMAAGLPVITSNATSLPEVVGDSALLFDPDNSEHMTDAIVRLCKDEAFNNELRDKGLQRAQQFTWAANADKVYQVYQQLWH